MTISAATQAVLLLTAHFSKASDKKAKPLTTKEWGRFALWLKEHDLTPEMLLSPDAEEKLALWSDTKITTERLMILLKRGAALALAADKWQRAGLWVMTRSDEDYPKRLKARLRNDSPPVLFGCGERSLLGQGGIAVVGSRNAGDEDLSYSRSLGEMAAKENYAIVSGGARGVDETAMLGALAVGGRCIGIMANDLLKAATSAKYRTYLMQKQLTLISPFYPEAGFNAGNAMQRNKYIYCLSDAAVAVHSGMKGGTWKGVIENLKAQWVPMWVKSNNDSESGNAHLVDKGAGWLAATTDDIDFSTLFSVKTHVSSEKNGDLFTQQQKKLSSTQLQRTQRIYKVFLDEVHELCRKKERTQKELVETLGLTEEQLSVWLTQAINDNYLEKRGESGCYRWQAGQ